MMVGVKNIYEEYGLKVGLEIHFQLNTGRKLFCKCPVGLTEDLNGVRVIRRLRPTQSELGQIDPAAYFEFKKGLVIEYIAPPEYTCLVELDEEPPHHIDKSSLDTVLRIANYMRSRIVDEIHVMRKIVVDGSNTTGFQRSAVIALGGEIYVDSIGKHIGIQSICLEEEAARLIERRGNKVIYGLDRLGIPLIEIATDPDISTPDEAVEVAKAIGRIVFATGMKRRGIGSVRQDINISVGGGTIVEVKGVQRLNQLRRVVEFEFRRHLGLLELAKILRDRGIKSSDFNNIKIIDLSSVFKSTKNKVIKKGLNEGGSVLGVRLPGFKGLLRRELVDGYWLGKDLAERVRFWTGLKGIFHTDELPGYGISKEELDNILKVSGSGEYDAVVFVVAKKRDAIEALNKVIERAREALNGVPYETRAAREDGSTFYMRPRPGMARMYPETDIPPIRITKDYLVRVLEHPIISPEETVKNIVEKYGIDLELAWRLYDSEEIPLFEKIMNAVKNINSIYVASFLTDRLPLLEDEGLDISNLDESLILEAFKAVDEGVTVKESIIEIIKYCIKNRCSVSDAIRELNLYKIRDTSEVERFIDELISSRSDIMSLPENIKRKRLIGIVMSKYRGKIDPKTVIKIIDEKLGGKHNG